VTETAARVLLCDDLSRRSCARCACVLLDAARGVPACDGREALDAASLRPPTRRFGDLLLPDGSGIAVPQPARWTAARDLVLSAVGEEDGQVAALEAGADDYGAEAFGPRELVARLHAGAAPRRQAPDEPVIHVDGREAALAARVVRRDGADVHTDPDTSSSCCARSPHRVGS
jgi:DNA-binding response OmpR family regulator